MPTPTPTSSHRCPKCGTPNQADALVCTQCHAILAEHSERPRTPGWVIALLVAIIILLLGYVIILARNVFLLHKF